MVAQTPTQEKESTIAFRCARSTRYLVQAAAAQRQMTRSEWLRQVVRHALEVGHEPPPGQTAEAEEPAGG